MKRFLVLILALTFCLFGCKEETPEKPVENIIEEVKEPIEETKTPMENVEVPEVEEPVEEIPTEPEVKKPIKNSEDNYIELYKADENTKEFTIQFPEEFYYEIESDYSFVSLNEFDWGDYLPFVRYPLDYYGEQGTALYAYSILGEHADTLDNGREIYKKINRKYAEDEYPIDKGMKPYGTPIDWNKEYEDYFFKSKVVYISEDASEFGVFHLINKRKENEGSFWNGKFELFKNEKLVFSESLGTEEEGLENEDSGLQDSVNILPQYYHKYKMPDAGKIMQVGTLGVADNTGLVCFPYDGGICAFSSDTGKLVLKIYLENINNIEIDYSIEQIINNRYAVVRFSTTGTAENETGDGWWYTISNSYANVYLYDLETGEKARIANYAFNTKVSPDLKYLIFTPYTWNEPFQLCNESAKMEAGFYICNLETKEMTCYNCSNIFYYQALGWINKDNLMKVANS